ncbi:GNAT family N-acetyltransferase [Streptomyces sp. NBC_00347]|uniref:GNAT family N-acetyltransferase n=1 Tax=Streptomyces sp. NBC_00347 TaxID=2975721 RepID=UPI00224E3F41|nr:GNAT family N-acetyltransferase [Streptomyces sp. NBC_00347]MCX5129540.1 GNAT family N-acetyltransferase [Streptomyces sp. NBC_00347]
MSTISPSPVPSSAAGSATGSAAGAVIPGTPVTPHVLDNPAWASLSGPHAAFAVRAGGHAARYAPDVAVFSAVADPADPRSWEALRSLADPDGVVSLSGVLTPPRGWETVWSAHGVQLIDTSLRAEPAPEAVRLGPADVPEVLELIELTKPGPFLPRTIELGTYLGIRHRGRLVAMAGERLRPPGWTEISAVCTHPAFRGRGLATRLVRAVAAGIRDRGDVPFLHTAAENTRAVRLYESIGFTVRHRPFFLAFRAPGGADDTAATRI